MEMPDARVEVAFETDPLTRPGSDDWTRVDVADDDVEEATPLVSVTTARGARVKTGELEGSSSTVVVRDDTSALQPSNTASPWYPNVKLRRRMRVVAEPDGDTDRALCGGFIERITPAWELDTEVAIVELVDLFTVLAPVALPASVVDHEMRQLGPVHYWPMMDTNGDFLDDVVGTADGRWLKPVDSGDVVTPYDPRTTQLVGLPYEDEGFDSPIVDAFQRGESGPVTLTAQLSVMLWVRFPERLKASGPGGYTAQRATMIASSHPSRYIEIVAQSQYGTNAFLFFQIGVDESNYAFGWNLTRPSATPIDDGNPHLITLTFNVTGSVVGMYIDTEPLIIERFDVGSVAAYAGRIEPALRLGGAKQNFSSTGASWYQGHVAYFDRIVTSDEIATVYAAGIYPWDGDTTGERLDRICDLVGVDDDDRDIDTGIGVCGPALLAGEPAVDYMRKIVATEGGALFQSPDIKLTFRRRPRNNPTSEVTYAGNEDDGIPYADAIPDYSSGRTINQVEIKRGGGSPLSVENPTSVADYGPLPTAIDTLARTAGGARAAGHRIVFRAGEPRTVITGVELNGRNPHVTLDATLDREILDPVTVEAALPGLALEQLSHIEHIEHTLDWAAKTWSTVIAVREHVVFPFMKFDTAGRGFDRSVWGA